MSRRALFKQADVTKALKGAKAAGVEIRKVQIGADGQIVMWPGAAADTACDQANPWDEELPNGSCKR